VQPEPVRGRRTSAELEAELKQLDAQHLRRRRREVQALAAPNDATRVWVDGRLLRNFSSNDYLGLSAHPELARAASACASRLPFGAGAAQLISGYSGEHRALEQELAAFTGRERALLFSSGYLANLGVISTLAGRHELVVADRLCHASLLDGARLSGATLKRYAHADSAAAASVLARDGQARRVALLVTEGVFSMDGDVAPLATLARLATDFGAALLVDDAHGLGVLGPSGRGTLEQAGLDAAAAPLLVGTLGKAFGSFGAFVAADAALIEYLLQHARSYIYTTAPPASVAAAARAALRIARDEPWRRERLQRLIKRLRTAAEALALPLSPSSSPIQPLMVGDSARALSLSAQLQQAGFWVCAIRPPTVPVGSARLRITVSAAHTDSDIDALAETLGQLWHAHRVSA
jgi:8-amino-7-oxononanoate synthase